MRQSLFALTILMAATMPALAADAPPMPRHTMSGPGAMSVSDGRELVPFPPGMRAHQLNNMRDHLQALDGILGDLAAADYGGAARIAADHLGLDSPAAAACKPRPQGAPPPPEGSMEAMMELYMPAAMRSIGLAMHTAASNFAAAAREAGTTGDSRAAYAALAQVTRNCVACHAAYRFQ